MSRAKKDVGMGLFVQCLYALSLHLVAVVFGTTIPTSLYIFGKCFIYLYRKELCQMQSCSIVVQPQAICWSTGSQLEWQCTCFLLL